MANEQAKGNAHLAILHLENAIKQLDTANRIARKIKIEDLNDPVAFEWVCRVRSQFFIVESFYQRWVDDLKKMLKEFEGMV